MFYDVTMAIYSLPRLIHNEKPNGSGILNTVSDTRLSLSGIKMFWGLKRGSVDPFPYDGTKMSLLVAAKRSFAQLLR